MRVWRQRNTAYSQRHIQETVPFGGGSIMVWGCVSHDCKLDLGYCARDPFWTKVPNGHS